jgi:hypothetical protein
MSSADKVWCGRTIASSAVVRLQPPRWPSPASPAEMGPGRFLGDSVRKFLVLDQRSDRAPQEMYDAWERLKTVSLRANTRSMAVLLGADVECRIVER